MFALSTTDIEGYIITILYFSTPFPKTPEHEIIIVIPYYKGGTGRGGGIIQYFCVLMSWILPTRPEPQQWLRREDPARRGPKILYDTQ